MTKREETPAEGEEVTAEPAWPRTVTLRHPIEFGKERIEVLEFRRGKLGDIKGMNLETVTGDQLVLLASRLCGKPTAALEKLDVDDAGEVMDIALDFFTKCLAAGKRHLR